MPSRFISPEYGVSPFTCPHCQTLAPQSSGPAVVAPRSPVEVPSHVMDDTMFLTFCTSCTRCSVWIRRTDYRRVAASLAPAPARAAPPSLDDAVVFTLVYPAVTQAPDPSDDLPSDVLADYREAAAVLATSPRSSAALLRLCLQKLCVHFGQPGKDINSDIRALVENGSIRSLIQKAMDTVRIAGNEAVHPGELCLDDDRGIALQLFGLVNLIAEEGIATPRRVDALYSAMPEAKRRATEARDRTTHPG